VTNDSCQIKEGHCISQTQEAESKSSKTRKQENRWDMLKYHQIFNIIQNIMVLVFWFSWKITVQMIFMFSFFTLCSKCMFWHFGEMYCLHLQGEWSVWGECWSKWDERMCPLYKQIWGNFGKSHLQKGEERMACIT